jgi:hypothetical protein
MCADFGVICRHNIVTCILLLFYGKGKQKKKPPIGGGFHEGSLYQSRLFGSGADSLQ